LSANLQITLADDLPTMAVDVVAPDLTVITTVMVSTSSTVIVPGGTADSLLRVHLPSGRAVTLNNAGSLERFITPELLGMPPDQQEFPVGALSYDPNEKGRGPSLKLNRRTLRSLQVGRSANVDASFRSLSVASEPLTNAVTDEGSDVWVSNREGERVSLDMTSGNEVEWNVDQPRDHGQIDLFVKRKDGRGWVTLLPYGTERVRLRIDRLDDDRTVQYSVRVNTGNQVADTLCNYMHRNDFAAAEAMTDWAMEQHDDRHAATISAYWLLQCRAFDRLQSLLSDPRRLGSSADYHILRASYLLHRWPDRQGEFQWSFKRVSHYFTGPTYTFGLRLLIDAWQLLNLPRRAVSFGQIAWECPLTTVALAEKGRVNIGEIEDLALDIQFSAQL
jgi:hypothetical protein